MLLSREEINERIALSKAVETSYLAPAPSDLKALPFQNAGVEYCLKSKQKRHLAGDEPGLGKTIQAILYANAKEYESITVVCPASLRENWRREIDKWYLGFEEAQIYRSAKTRLDPKNRILITSYNLANSANFIRHLKANKNGLLIVDESQALKNAKAARTRTVLGRGGLMDMHDESFFLSGTQLLNRPVELWPLMSRACPSALAGMDFWKFAEKFCGLTDDGDYSGASNMRELGARLRAYLMFRRLKKNVLKDLPDKFARLVYLDPNPRAKQAIKRLGKFSIDELGRGVSAGFEGMSEARRELGVSKIEPALEYIKTQLESRHKVGVMAWHRDVIEGLEAGLAEFNPVKIYGGMSDDAKQAAVDKFQNDPTCRVFIGSIPIMTGLTLTAASYCAFVEASWVPADNQQAGDRFHRIGQKDNVELDFLVFPNSMDETILRAHIEKAKVIKEVFHDA